MGLSDKFTNFNEMLKLAKDENFRKFFMHPKVQELMKDKEFESAVKEKNMFKLMNHPEFMAVMKDPEIAGALEEMRKKLKNLS